MLKRIVCIRKVARVNSGGKIRSVSAMVIVGNENGVGGYGMGRAADTPTAVMKATKIAQKTATFIPRFDNRTIYSDVDYKYNSVNLLMRTTIPGISLQNDLL